MKSFKKQISKTVVLVIFVIALSSCKKNETQTYLPTAQTLNNLFNANLESIKQHATFDAATTFVFTSAKGTSLTIDGTCLRKNGNPVTGNVELEFVELYDKGTMAMTNKPTMGINTNNEEEVLESGGEFYINVTQDSVALTTTCFIKLETPASLTTTTLEAMLPFKGNIDSNGKLTWETATFTDYYTTINPNKYHALFSDFGWFNYDKFYADPRPKTPITVLVPTGYANASIIFLSINTQPNSLGGLGGKYPIGLECKIIFVTEDNGNFRYAVKPITLVANQQVTFSISETTLATAAQFKTALNTL